MSDIQYESESNINYASNVYMDGEKYYWILYHTFQYHFDDIGHKSEKEARESLNKKVDELNEM